jgi:acetolactate synthase-1/2/3 large subunit
MAIEEERTTSRRVGEAIVDALDQADVPFVLGMPGGLTGPIYSSLFEHPRIRVIQVREESIATTMAEAFGRLAGRPLVVVGQGQWIVGNAGQGIIEAHLGSSPVVILTDMTDGGPLSHHGPYQSATGDYGTWDIRTALSAVTKRVFVSHYPGQAVQHTQLVVLRTDSLRGRIDIDTKPAIYDSAGYLPAPTESVDEKAIAGVVSALRNAKRPVIVAGNGVRLSGAYRELASLAERIDAPVATTSSGKGVFDEQGPLAAGVMGTFGWPEANAVVGEADVVLAVGTKLAPHDTADENTKLLDPSTQTLIQLDIEPMNIGWTHPVQHSLVGDARFLLSRLLEADLHVEGRAQGAERRVAEAALEHGDRGSDLFSDDSLPFAPQRLVSILEEELSADAIITCDAGENRLFMLHWFHSRGEGKYLQPAAGGGMGYAVRSALGAKLARPESPVVAVCGDGGFAMSLHVLMTAVQENLPVGVIIFNNGALGWVLHGMGKRAVAAEFTAFDHAAIARSLGCDGMQVTSTDELRAALSRLKDLKTPLVIDIPTSLATSFKDITQELAAQKRDSGY